MDTFSQRTLTKKMVKKCGMLILNLFYNARPLTHTAKAGKLYSTCRCTMCGGQ